jgi:hypothetical protein
MSLGLYTKSETFLYDWLVKKRRNNFIFHESFHYNYIIQEPKIMQDMIHIIEHDTDIKLKSFDYLIKILTSTTYTAEELTDEYKFYIYYIYVCDTIKRIIISILSQSILTDYISHIMLDSYKLPSNDDIYTRKIITSKSQEILPNTIDYLSLDITKSNITTSDTIYATISPRNHDNYQLSPRNIKKKLGDTLTKRKQIPRRNSFYLTK